MQRVQRNEGSNLSGNFFFHFSVPHEFLILSSNENATEHFQRRRCRSRMDCMDQIIDLETHFQNKNKNVFKNELDRHLLINI